MISRTLDPSEFTKIEDFYNKNRYGQPVSPDDRFLIIEDGSSILAALRVCHEEGFFVLRGMRVSEDFQRKGIGTNLLDYFDEFIDNNDCYCIAHSHLTSFYGRVGFEEIDPNEAPEFLTARLAFYRTESGLDVRLLYKPSTENQPAR